MAGRERYDAVAAEQRRPGVVGDGARLDLRDLVRLATLAASSHNTQPWRFRLGRREIAILPDFSRRCPVVDPEDAHLWRSLGCAVENLVHAAAGQGHAAHVAFDPAEGAVRVTLERCAAAVPDALFHALTHRQCARTLYDGRPVAAEDRAALERTGRGAGVRTLLVDGRGAREALRDLVVAGDRAQLDDPAFRRELIGWLRTADAAAIRTGDGLAGRASGRPQAPEWLKRPLMHFVLTAKGQAEEGARNLAGTPIIAVIVADADGPAAWVEVGRVCERLALMAAVRDLRCAFVNQPIETPSLRPALHEVLGLGAETAQLMLRVGHGPMAPFSLRRPVDAVIMRA